MKRLLLSLIISLTASTISSAQIRIEKRHYNKGWYISGLSKKQHPKEATAIAPADVPENKMLHEDFNPAKKDSAVNPTIIPPVDEIVRDEKHIESQLKKNVAGQTVPGITTPAKSAIALEQESGQPFTASKSASKNKSMQADPGDNLWSYLFSGFAKALLWVAIVAGIILLLCLLLNALGLGAVALGFLSLCGIVIEIVNFF